MPQRTNGDRADHAAQAIAAYAKAQGLDVEAQSTEEWLIDLITDIRHYAAEWDSTVDVDGCVRMSRDHFAIERGER